MKVNEGFVMTKFAPITRHKMSAPFPDMNHAKVKLLTATGWLEGEFATAEDPDAGTFGARVDCLVATKPTGRPHKSEMKFWSWDLTEEQLREVVRTNDPDIPFSAHVV